MSHTRALRSILARAGCTVMPGVTDGLSARMVTMAGFEAAYMTGFGTSLARLGMPDIGLLTMTEMVETAGRIVDASGLPVIADADTGYGNAINVTRTVRQYEKAGVAGIHLEDQTWPKRCGHLAGKTVIPAAEMVSKIKAAVDSREDAQFVVIARTDAYSVEGYEKTLERTAAYQDAGADVLFIEGIGTHDEVRAAVKAFQGTPMMYNMASSPKIPHFTRDELSELGYRMAIFPNYIILAAIPAIKRMLGELKTRGSVAHLKSEMATFNDALDIAGLARFNDLERKYSASGTEPGA